MAYFLIFLGCNSLFLVKTLTFKQLIFIHLYTKTIEQKLLLKRPYSPLKAVFLNYLILPKPFGTVTVAIPFVLLPALSVAR